MTDDRFELLVEKHLEGTLADDEARELVEALEDSPDLRARMLAQCSTANLLARTQAGAPADLAPRVQAALRSVADKEALVSGVMRRLPARSTARVRSGLIAAGFAAAAVVGLFLFRPGPRTIEPDLPVHAVAESVKGGVEVVDPDGRRAVEAGHRIEVGDTVELADRSELALRLPDGGRASIRGEAKFEGLCAWKWFKVKQGTATLQVPGTEGRVITPHAEAELRDARVTVSVASGDTRLEVASGRAEVTRRGVRTAVAAGQYVVAAPSDDPMPVLPAVDPRRVADSVRRGVDYLKKAPLPSCKWQAPLPSDELVALAFAHAGVPEGDPLFRKLLAQVLGAKLQRVYSVSLQAVLLAKLDPAKHRARLLECAQFLVDNQCANGQWSYGEAVPPLEGDRVVRRRDGPATGNNSCSNFAARGLRACADAGLEIPRETLVRARQAWMDLQRPDRDPSTDAAGWCYTREESPHHPYASMTAGGLAALAVYDRLLGDDPGRDEAARRAVTWLTRYFSVTENAGPVEELMAREMSSDAADARTEYFYSMAALERAATLLDLDRFGSRDWYAEGVQAILASQRPDGSWHSGMKRCQPVWDTCHAILFLKRATRPMVASVDGDK